MTIDERSRPTRDGAPRPVTDANQAVVGDLMSRFVATVRDDRSLGTALQMLRTTGLRHLVVVNKDGEFIGVISDRLGVELAGRDARELALARVRDLTFDGMAQTTARCRIVDAAHLVLRQSAGALAVTDRNCRVVGIITGADLLRGLAEIVDRR
jgi:predicted transcriptional regulator